MVDKVKKQTDKLFEIFEDKLIEKIKKLNLKDEDLITKTIKDKPEKPKKKSPVIPKEKQCTKMKKDGNKCTAPKCYKESCWPHLLKNEREEYINSK